MIPRDAKTLAEQLRNESITVLEIAEQTIERVEALDDALQCFSYFDPAAIRAQAVVLHDEAQRGEYRGPLHGVPLAVKDLCDVEGLPTAAGTVVLGREPAERDGTVVARLREAGALIVGKVRMSEGAFAEHHPELPTPLNPWSAEVWVGASSSGSAAAVASGMASLAIATDTGGSIRYPSAATGLTGLKPTWGRVSRAGAVEFAGSLDHIGPIAHTVADCADMLAVMAGLDPRDPTSLPDPVPDYAAALSSPEQGLLIGFDPEFSARCDEPTRTALDAAAATLARLGHTIVEVRMPDVSEVVTDWPLTCGIEASIVHEATFPSQRERYGSQLAGLLDQGIDATAQDYHRLRLRRQAFEGRLNLLLSQVDALLVQVTAVGAPSVEFMEHIGVGREWREVIMNANCPFDFAGVPTLTLPGGFTPEGLPVGFQLVAPRLEEARLIGLGHQFQCATDFHLRRPGTAWAER